MLFSRNYKICHRKWKSNKDYPDDTPYPSRLILGFDGERPLHVVSAYNAENDTEYVITVYEPDVQKWSNNFTERR